MLNARNNVTEFYAKHGYAMIGEAETLFRRDSPCADGESVVVMIYNKIAWITIYVGVITYLFSALIVSSACYQLIVVGNPTCQLRSMRSLIAAVSG